MSGAAVLIRAFPLGARAELRVMFDTFNGQPHVDLRTWGDFHARGLIKKDVSLPIRDLPALVAALEQAVDQAQSLLVQEKGGAKAA